MMRWLYLALMSCVLFYTCHAQVQDTVIPDVGVNISWISLATNYKSINSVSDVIRNVQFGVETRAWKFWIQTGVMIGWSGNKRFAEEYNITVFSTMCYEFPIFRKRVVLGLGPIASYYHYYSKAEDWNGNAVSSNLGSLGVNFEVTVPIYAGLSLETCSDIGVGFNQHEIVPRIIRLASFGINYRFKAYPK
ncbi:MAG: hypothetical protein ACI9P8_002068 [Bacteroidia bacterium]